MLFHTLDFWLFLAVVWPVHWLLRPRGQRYWLLGASYFFYACWDWRFLSLLWISTLVDYGCGLALAGCHEPSRRRRWLWLSLATNLGILGFFKYFNFFSDSAAQFFSGLGWAAEPWLIEVLLPIGISFYTFQTLSYTIDVYRRQLEPERDFATFALFVALFPQLVAGPIERAKRLIPQIRAVRRLDSERVRVGAWLVLWGLFKKVVVADNLARIVDACYASGNEPSGGEVLIATYAFAFQIYADFSGYTDMARGVAKWFGFDFMLNFRLPYLATNPRDFWARWHISLSTWLRDYVYIPLGGSRCGRTRTLVNLMLTMVLGGLWHGAAWTFVVWGFFHGLLLGIHRAWTGAADSISGGGNAARSAGSWLWRVFIWFHLVCLGWLFFRAESLSQAWVFLSAVATDFRFSLEAQRWAWQLAILAGPLVALELHQGYSRDTNAIFRLPVLVRGSVVGLIVLMLLGWGSFGAQEFIYFQF